MRGLLERAAVRRAVRTFLQTALALLVPGLLGWLNGLTDWARAEGQAPFPDARSLAYLGVVAIVSGVVAAVTLLWNATEDALGRGLLRTPQPTPARDERGEVRLPISVYGWVGIFIVVLVIGVLLLFA